MYYGPPQIYTREYVFVDPASTKWLMFHTDSSLFIDSYIDSSLFIRSEENPQAVGGRGFGGFHPFSDCSPVLGTNYS